MLLGRSFLFEVNIKMKKHQEVSNEDPFFEEKLPIRLWAEEDGKSQRDGQPKGLLPMLLLILLLITAAVCCLVLLGTDGDPETCVPAVLPEETPEWRGAFASREILEKCISSAVKISVGRAGSIREWSGLVLTEDGWIATCAKALGEGDEGIIRVSLGDGREYEAVSFKCKNGIALLKISADGLVAAELEDRQLCAGEQIICLRQGTEPVSGQVTIPDDGGLVRISALLGESGAGAPVFDHEGHLVAMASLDQVGENGDIAHAIPWQKLFSEKEKIKS